MSKTSEYVKQWRKNTKKIIVELMGQKCCICNYMRCLDALELHHIDPETKEFSFGALRASPKEWSKIEEELKKCVLVCANCHREIESGMIDSPKQSTYNNFDGVIDFKHRELDLLKTCEACLNNFRPYNRNQKYCSLLCRKSKEKKKKRPTKIEWPNYNDLLLDVTENGYSKVGRKLGVSDNAVRNHLKTNIPGKLSG